MSCIILETVGILGIGCYFLHNLSESYFELAFEDLQEKAFTIQPMNLLNPNYTSAAWMCLMYAFS